MRLARVAPTLTALAAGALAVTGFAPFQAWPATLLSLGVLFFLWMRAPRARSAAWLGFVFGMGLFATGVPWIYVSLHTHGGMPSWMAVLAVGLFAAYLSLFPALAGALSKTTRFNITPFMRLTLLMPAAWVVSEMLRGWVVSGFPWLIVGYVQTPGWLPAPLAGVAPVLGVFGISWLMALTAALLLLATTSPPHHVRAVIALVGIWGAGFVLSFVSWTTPSGAPLAVSLLQGNVPQRLKWRADQREATLTNYMGLVNEARGRLIVLPETALPMFLHDVPAPVAAALDARARANGGDLILGVSYLGTEPGKADPDTPIAYFNGAVTFGMSPGQRAAKQHLVAFGEFVPPFFSWAYQWLNIPMSGYTPGAAAPPMTAAGHRIAVNICYEDTFGREIALALPEAELMVNISNMAWFGEWLAADQHAQFSQMRARETGRWMLRATNTGVTAAIDETGRIVAALPQTTRGVLETTAIPRTGTTPYVIWRDWAAGALLVAVFVLLFMKGQRRRP